MMRSSFHSAASLRRTLTLLAALAISVACSSEPDGPDRTIDIVDDVGAGEDAGDLDSGQPDADVSEPGDVDDDVEGPDADASMPDADADDPEVDEPDAEDPDASDAEEPDTDEPDVELPPTECDAATIDLGVLEAGANVVELGPGLDAVAGINACDSVAQSSSVIVRFELPADGVLSFDGEAIAVSLLQQPCSGVGGFCASEIGALNVIAGVPFYAAVARPDVETQLDVVYSPHQACEPVGQMTCVDASQLEACTTGFASIQVPIWVTSECPAGCENDACVGNSCDNPIVVEESISLQIRGEALSNTFDNFGAPNCVWDTPSEGRELVFQVENVQVGETIAVEIDDPLNFYRVSILSSCAQSAECLASDVPGAVMEFEASEAGTYFVVIDSDLDIPAAPEIRVEVLASSDI
ncbi:hypothetical protein EA187_15365 [Lujinxingia sediminis]|uniref:Peptidase C-terminal archaeal/bacterial domain-containing protein n=1 Tax=Lujinxingia sediminis TaxID=2480984 RepID=A0ABY0CQ06_9DELT|nr:hypothetical protein [Lujinxingia sediminis]RVU42568.1 hypothetical protein EA187_15365 [Lujinxingia sediminis]